MIFACVKEKNSKENLRTRESHYFSLSKNKIKNSETEKGSGVFFFREHSGELFLKLKMIQTKDV